VELIDHAVAKHGRKVKFLNLREALERLEKNALPGESLRSPEGGDNGLRLLDVNADGYMDVVGSSVTRIWEPKTKRWNQTGLPESTSRARFGVIGKDGAVLLMGKGKHGGAWTFDGKNWMTAPHFLNGLQNVMAEANDIRFRDFDADGVCELVVSKGVESAIYQWSESAKQWKAAPFGLPSGISLLDAEGRDNGVRFADFNADGLDDLYFSNEQRFSIHLWAKAPKANLGWKAGWSHLVLSGERKGDVSEPPAITRAGPHRNNGAWFKDGHLVIQNENTAKLEGVVDRRSFSDLIAFKVPPPKSPQDSLAAMQLRPGFVAELVVSEPLVVDPVAFEWDAAGRLYVVELRDYPLGMDGNGKAGGVVKLLTDTDGDTFPDKASVFLEDLPCPTGLIPWRKGLIVCAAPDIFYAEDTNGDGRADLRRVLFTGLTAGNQQHRANGFEWGLDGWVYGANGESGGTIKAVETALGGKPKEQAGVAISGRDFRFRPDTGEFEAESGATQFGRRRDDWGNWFGNNNSIWLWHYTIADHYLRRNPKLAVKTTRKVRANYASPSRVFAVSEQPIRFNQPQSLGHVTSACSPSPYRDDLFGADFASSVFISEPVHNVVHREVVEPRGATFESHRAADEADREFLASTDVWFRPAMLKTGPDGALYIADYYRFVLEHPEWIAPETQARLNLRAGEDKGRIYRVRPAKAMERKIPNLEQMNSSELVAAMDCPSGWQRDTAQRLLAERGDRAAVAPLALLAREGKEPKARAQAIAALALLDKITPEVCIAGLSDRESGVRREALRASEVLAGKSPELQKAILALENEPDPATRHQLAFTLGEWKSPETEALLTRLAGKDGTDAEMRVAILSSAGSESLLMTTLREKPAGDRGKKAQAPVVAPGDPNRAKIIASYKDFAKLKGDASRGGETFKQLCSVCHRLKGVGREIGPDLAMVAGKPDEWLLAAIFDPNQAVEDRYRAHLITMKDGSELAGIVAGETGNNITLRAADGTDRAILRSDIKVQKLLGRSLMPEGLEGALKVQDLADLVSYLRAP
jgi:putative membrane-bound dehydrogenase-like protein